MTDTQLIRVADVMTEGVITVAPTATVADAVTLMNEHRTSSLIVERRDGADEFGIIVVSDIAEGVLSKDLSPARVNVYEIMAKPVLTLPSEMQVKYAVRLLVRFQLSRALVVDHDRNPLGIVTLRDMVLRSMKA